MSCRAASTTSSPATASRPQECSSSTDTRTPIRLHLRQLPGRPLHQTSHPTLTQDRRSQPRARQARQVPDRWRTHHHRLHRRRDGGTHQRGPSPSPHGSRQRPPRARLRQAPPQAASDSTQALPVSHPPPAQLRLHRRSLVTRRNPQRPDRPRHRRPRPHHDTRPDAAPPSHTIEEPAHTDATRRRHPLINRHAHDDTTPTQPDTPNPENPPITQITVQTAHDDTTPTQPDTPNPENPPITQITVQTAHDDTTPIQPDTPNPENPPITQITVQTVPTFDPNTYHY